ncbi:MAG: hypothetical protein WA777_06585 [Rhodanobacter sp.]
MIFRQIVVATAMLAGCLWITGCVEDTTRTMAQDREGYLSRVFVPTALSSSVQEKLAQSTGKPPSFNKIVIKQKSTIKYVSTGATVDSTNEAFYLNAGNGLIRQIDIEYSNGIEANSSFALTYRGAFPLMQQTLNPADKIMPHMGQVKSITSMDLSFDQPTLSLVYVYTSNAPRARTLNREIACGFTKTYPASTLNASIQGAAREYACNFLNENGVVDYEADYVYLQDYGVAIVKGQHTNKMKLTRDLVDFKVE